MPIIIPSSAPSNVLRYEWLDPTGVLRDLTRETSPNLWVRRGTTGLGLPGVELIMDKFPLSPGSILRHIQTKPAELNVPLYVGASTFTDLINSFSDLRKWFNTGDEVRRTPGYFRVTRPDNQVRQIACYYNGGLDGNMDEGGITFSTPVISLIAPDPYFTDIDDTSIVYPQSALDYFQGQAPTQIIINTGDMDAYPVWEFVGPLTNLVVTNGTSGKSFALTASGGVTLGAGEILIVDTRPTSQRQTLQVIDGDGTNLFSKLTTTSQLWWFVPGENRFKIELSNMTTATEVHLTYLPRYRGVLR